MYVKNIADGEGLEGAVAYRRLERDIEGLLDKNGGYYLKIRN